MREKFCEFFRGVLVTAYFLGVTAFFLGALIGGLVLEAIKTFVLIPVLALFGLGMALTRTPIPKPN